MPCPHPRASMWPLASAMAFLTVALSDGKNAGGGGKGGGRVATPNSGRRGQAKGRGPGLGCEVGQPPEPPAYPPATWFLGGGPTCCPRRPQSLATCVPAAPPLSRPPDLARQGHRADARSDPHAATCHHKPGTRSSAPRAKVVAPVKCEHTGHLHKGLLRALKRGNPSRGPSP